MDPRTAKLLAEREQRAAVAPPQVHGALGPLHTARTWVQSNTRAAKAGAAVLAVVLLAAYYMLVTIPSQRLDRAEEAARIAEKIKSETTTRQTAMTECLSKVETDATTRWAAACKVRRERAGCTLSAHQTDALDKEESLARNACLTRFSIGD